MQTFLPYASYAKTAETLDQKRLGKQRVETLQVMQVLLEERLITSDKVTYFVEVLNEDGDLVQDERTRKVPRPKALWERQQFTPKGWSHHPAVLMWRGHELALFEYQKAICEEWTSRGYSDSCLEKTEYLIAPHRDQLSDTTPDFIGDEEFHESHKSNLFRKDEEYYAQYKAIGGELPYKWPVTL